MTKERLLEELRKSTRASYVSATDNGVTVYSSMGRAGYSVYENNGIVQFGDFYTNVVITLESIEYIYENGDNRYTIRYKDAINGHTLYLYFD